jgi:hypothetical protein
MLVVQTDRRSPEALKYWTDAEIGGCVKRPADARLTVSGFAV